MGAEITICDKDDFEEKNLMRQMCRKSDAESGANKAEVACMDIAGIMHATPVKEFITHGGDLHTYLFDQLKKQKREEAREADLAVSVFILAVDNDATRKVFYDVLHEAPFDTLNIAVIDPGNDYYTGQVGLYLRLMGKVPFCDPRQIYEQLRKPKDRVPGDEGCQKEVETSPQLITANMMAATLVVHTVYCLLANERCTDEVTFDLRERQVGATGEWAGEGRKVQGDGEPATARA